MGYSNDLRWRVIKLKVMENRRPRSIARTLGMSVSTVNRIVKRFYRYGHVRSARMGRPDITDLLTRAQLLVLMEYVLSKSTGFLQEMKEYVISTTGSCSNILGLFRVLKRYRYSRKRVSFWMFSYARKDFLFA